MVSVRASAGHPWAAAARTRSSTRFVPGVSPNLDAFLDRVDTVLSIHGYGRHDDFWAVLVGGADRAAAHHVAGHLRGVLPEEYRVVDDVEAMPRSLRGLHPDNPVNRGAGGGVQVDGGRSQPVVSFGACRIASGEQRDEPVVDLGGRCGAVVAAEHRLGVEQVDVAGATVHEQLDHGPCRGPVLR